MSDSPSDATVSVRRTPLQHAGYLGAFGFLILLAAGFMSLLSWAIPDLLSFPPDPENLLLLAILLVGCPYLLVFSLIKGLRVLRRGPEGILFEIGPSGLVILSEASGRRHHPALRIPWAEITEIRTGSGSRGASELSVLTRNGRRIRLDDRLIVPHRRAVLEHMLRFARQAGCTDTPSRRFLFFADFRIWTLERAT
jgi:hypothetical protein